MKFGAFYEHQFSRPWEEGRESKLFQDALSQVELGDGENSGGIQIVTKDSSTA